MDYRALVASPAVPRVASVLLPLSIGAVLYAFRDSLSQSAAVLVFTLGLVAVAATGDRAAGIIAALASTAWFDFFFTTPFLSFTIHRQDDIVLAVLFILVGLAVTELALWGRRRGAQAQRRAGYLDGVLGVCRLVPGASPDVVPVDRNRAICEEIRRVLGVDSCTYATGTPAGGWAVVDADGDVTIDGRTIRPAVAGLPIQSITAIPVRRDGRVVGHFDLVASTRVVRPTAEQLKVAVLLAEQVAHA